MLLSIRVVTKVEGSNSGDATTTSAHLRRSDREYTLKLLDFLSSFPEWNRNPVLQIVGARLLPFTPIPVRSESRSKAPKSLLADLSIHTPILAYVNTPVTNTLRESQHTMF
ncbi:hypothetical protein LXL04_008148 [Taraxacum kok-saghyz]